MSHRPSRRTPSPWRSPNTKVTLTDATIEQIWAELCARPYPATVLCCEAPLELHPTTSRLTTSLTLFTGHLPLALGLTTHAAHLITSSIPVPLA